MIAERVLAVLAALCLVTSFGLATLLPAFTPLARAIAMTDQSVLVGLQDAVRATLSDWTWRSVFLPVLMRPSWLFPLALGLILGGAALTVASRRRLPGSPRWRN